MTGNNGRAARRGILKAGVATAAAPMVIGRAHARDKVKWRVQAVWPKASASFAGSLGVLADELAKRTDGRFALELLGAGEIAKGNEIYNIVRRGVVEMGSTSPSYQLDEAELMGQYGGIPGTLREPWEMMYLTKNLGLEAALNKELEPKGVFYMADKSYPTELVLKAPIKVGQDLGGVKVRTSGNLLKYLGAAGFAVQRIDGPELYQALATGVVDGAHWGGAMGALSMKLWEVAKYQMKPALLIASDVYVINTAAYRKLPEDLRQIFTALVEERYYQRTVEYQYDEFMALKTGLQSMQVEVARFPDDVLERLSKASQTILDAEMARGPEARAGGEKLVKLMQDLGYR